MQIHVLASSHWMWVECCHHNYVNMVSLFFCNLQVTILKTWRFYSFIYLFIYLLLLLLLLLLLFLIWRRDIIYTGCVHKVLKKCILIEIIKSTRKCILLVLRVLNHYNNDIKSNVLNSIFETCTPLNMWLFLFLHINPH